VKVLIKLVLETATARKVRRVGYAATPRTLKDLGVMVRHDHLGPEVSIDNAVVNLYGVIYDALNVQVWNLWPRDIHGCPHYILDQNSAVFQNRTHLWGW
jgi:hypothetical protein